MDIKEFSTLIKEKAKELDDMAKHRLPVKIGRMAKDHYQDNFRKGGFVNKRLQRWPATKRQQSGGTSAASNYGPLLSRRNHLFSSIKYMPSDYRVRVANDVPYASIHNYGGETHPTVTPKMRKFAWAMYYNTSGIGKKPSTGKKTGNRRKNAASPQAEMWKRLALTKKKKLKVRIPKRQFIGESATLNTRIEKTIENEIRKILK